VSQASSLAFFGSLTIDDLVFADGSTRWGIPGGNAVFAAMGAALWTGHASVVAPLGPDYPVELLDKRLDLSRCPPVSHTLRNWGLYEDDGRRHFISRSSSRNWSEFCPRSADASSGGQIAAHVAAMPRKLGIELIKELRKTGTRIISLDLDDHDLLRDTNLDETIELIRGADLFLPSRQDAAAIFPDTEPLEGLRLLRHLTPDVFMIAVKCGAEGVIAHIAGTDEALHIPALQIPLVDATGAGDAFCGGVLAGFAEHGDPIEGLLYGVVSASFCIEALGFAGLAAASEEQSRERLAILRPLMHRRPMKSPQIDRNISR
jgi:sugar/nucleoside kinase (ribokinase family)